MRLFCVGDGLCLTHAAAHGPRVREQAGAIDGTGWFFINILAPLLLPVLGILPLRLLPLPGPAPGLKLMSTVKDGQLCWAVIAMSAAAMYEVWDAINRHQDLPSWGGFAFAGMALLMLPAILIAAGGAAFSTPLAPTVAAGPAWLRHYRVFVSSAAMTLIAASGYTVMHFGIAVQSASHPQ
jgi:hypothetical protein